MSTEINNEAINTTETKGESTMTTEFNVEEYFDKMAQEVYDLTQEYDHDTTRISACRKFVETSYERKSFFRNRFRQFPEWNEEKQMLIFKRDVARGIDRTICSNFFEWARQSVYDIFRSNIDDMRMRRYELYHEEDDNVNDTERLYAKLVDFTWHIYGNLYQHMENKSVDYVNNLFPELKIHYGAKTSRVVNKVLTRIYNLQNFEQRETVVRRDSDGTVMRTPEGFVLYEEKMSKKYNRKFAEFADAVNPFKIKRWMIFSLNPIDFLTMSFGNSWSSCHTIDKYNKRCCGNGYHGMYMGGTLSYALDDVSVIVYTVDEKYEPTEKDVMWNGNWYGGFETQSKINRQMIHFEGNVMIQGRMYPQATEGDRDLYKEFRDVEEKVIADCLGRPNLWNYKQGIEENRRWCKTHYGSHHYEDYFWYEDTGACILKGDNGEYNGNYYLIEIGAHGIDLNSGYEINGDGTFNGVLTESECITCASCGRPIDPDDDDVAYIDGDYYCRDCIFWCDYHEEYEPDNREHTYINGYGYVCDEGIDEMVSNGYLRRCESCGEIVNPEYDDDGYYTDDGDWYCSLSCANYEGYVWSEEHNSLIYKDDAVKVNGEWYYEDDLVECPECGQLANASDFSINLDGDHVCPDCYEEMLNREAERIREEREGLEVLAF